MKRYFVIISMFILTGFSAFSQEEDAADDKAGKLQQRMTEYIQRKLSLNKSEAEKFRPVFLRYILELRKTHRENISDKPVLQLRVAELRVKFRNEFRQILDEQRANKVFEHQREFENTIRQEIKARKLERISGGRRTNFLEH